MTASMMSTIRPTRAAGGALLCAGLFWGLAPFAVAGQSKPSPKPLPLSVTLTPHMTGGRVDFVEVSMTVASPSAKPGIPFLKLPLHVPVLPDIAYAPQNLVVRDRRGTVPTTPIGTRKAGDQDSAIAVLRQTDGTVTIRYRAPAYVMKSQPFPPYELRAEDKSIIAAGYGFMLTPAGSQQYRISLRWNLSGMPKGSIGVWSFGEGNVMHVGTGDSLQKTYYAAGPLQRYSEGGFGLYFGSPAPFDVAALGRPAAKLYAYYKQFFRVDPQSYRVFFRNNIALGGGSGAALTQSFIFDYTSPDPDSYGAHIAHEMAHTFISPFEPGAHSAWYNEGMAEHYSGVLGVRAGTLSPAQFLDGVDYSASRYYTLPARDLPNDEIPGMVLGGTSQTRSPWRDQGATQLVYGRARLYLSSINAKIKAATGGKHSLDDVTLRMNELGRLGQPHDEAVWLSLVEAEIGPQARTDHAAFLAGKLFVPASDAFGPCFARERYDIGRFDIGFDPAAVQGKLGVVRQLVPGSAAARAGAQEGDQVVGYSAGKAYFDATATVTVTIKRGEETIKLSYVPRSSDTIDAYRWVRVSGIPDTACGI